MSLGATSRRKRRLAEGFGEPSDVLIVGASAGICAVPGPPFKTGQGFSTQFDRDRRIREEFVPIVKKTKGFVRYYWLDTGEGEGASVGVFKDKAGADESVELATDYVQEHLSKLLTWKPEIIEGPIKAPDGPLTILRNSSFGDEPCWGREPSNTDVLGDYYKN